MNEEKVPINNPLASKKLGFVSLTLFISASTPLVLPITTIQ
jgi:hypothetical protein